MVAEETPLELAQSNTVFERAEKIIQRRMSRPQLISVGIVVMKPNWDRGLRSNYSRQAL